MRPMLATATPTVPGGAGWAHEVKWDGVRALVAANAGTVRLTSRNENDITAAWPELATPPSGPDDLVVDGEIIALNERGLPDFRVLQERMHVRKAATVARLADQVPAILMVFDLLRLDGVDLTGRRWAERRERLEALDLAGSSWQVPPTYDDGAGLHQATRDQGLEGTVSKRLDSRYRPGERSKAWLKLAHRHRGSFVVGGWRPQVGTRDRLAALLVGEPTASGLAYRGRVGSGLTGRTAALLAERLAPLASDTNPFAPAGVDPDGGVPAVDARGTFWVEPVLVVDVDTHGLGYARLRQPSFQGLRDDVGADDLLRAEDDRG